MSTAPLQPSRLHYDPTETFEAFQARQRHAYRRGKAAWRARQISGQALQLYDELVRYVGTHQFCWVKEETLATQLGRSLSTIKRWMQQLAQANLIRRERRFGGSSLTYIAAYDLVDHAADHEVARGVGIDASVPSEDAAVEMPASTSMPTEAAGDGAAPASPVPFFGREAEPSISSSVDRDSVKSHQLNLGGGAIPIPGTRTAADEQTASTERLQAEGVTDRGVLHELRQRSAAEIERVIRYVAHCRTRDDPRRPGLIVHLLRRGFGVRRNKGHGRSVSPPATICDPPAHSEHPLPPAVLHDQPASARHVTAGDGVLDQLWQHVLAQLAPTVDALAYQTWLATSRLLLLDDSVAVVGVPTVFARDEIDQTYAGQLQAGLRQQCGRPIVLQVIIGSTPYRL
jgi:hypothetical protein